jgi:hypothetical protein
MAALAIPLHGAELPYFGWTRVGVDFEGRAAKSGALDASCLAHSLMNNCRRLTRHVVRKLFVVHLRHVDKDSTLSSKEPDMRLR